MRIGAIVVGALLGATALAGVSFQSIFSNDPKDYRMEDPGVRSEVLKALKARAEGNLPEALKHLSAASALPISEYPNYRLWPDLAEIYCRTGQKAQGRALLNDFTCAVDVMAARRKCSLDETSDAPNPALSPRCYQTVCGGMYEAYYGWEPGTSVDDKRYSPIVSKLRKICS